MLQKELAKRLKARYDTKMDGNEWMEVSSDGIPLCRIKYNGQYLSNADQNLSDEYRSKIADIQEEISTVREYVGLYEHAPQMKAADVSDYRQLAAFGDTVLAATYSEKNGFMFCTWKQNADGDSVFWGDYSPNYEYAKEAFAVRSGLVSKERLFSENESAYLCRCVDFAKANCETLTYEQERQLDNIGDNVADRITISQPTTLNLDAKIISPDDMGNNSQNFCALIVDADTTINAGENGGIDTGRNGGYALNVRKGANLTITGGSYYGGGTAVQVQEGTLTITGGHFAVEAFGEPYGYNFLLNCVDSAYKNGSAKIIVKGGTFVNFDPSNNTAEGAGTNFVADGYKVVSASQTDGEVWYTVVPK